MNSTLTRCLWLENIFLVVVSYHFAFGCWPMISNWYLYTFITIPINRILIFRNHVYHTTYNSDTIVSIIKISNLDNSSYNRNSVGQKEAMEWRNTLIVTKRSMKLAFDWTNCSISYCARHLSDPMTRTRLFGETKRPEQRSGRRRIHP